RSSASRASQVRGRRRPVQLAAMKQEADEETREQELDRRRKPAAPVPTPEAGRGGARAAPDQVQAPRPAGRVGIRSGEREEERMKGSDKPKKLQKKAAQKTMKEKRNEKKSKK